MTIEKIFLTLGLGLSFFGLLLIIHAGARKQNDRLWVGLHLVNKRYVCGIISTGLGFLLQCIGIWA